MMESVNTLFLVGNPNVGKSVFFSRITGVDVMVSNYPGTTVEIASAHVQIAGRSIEVIDLPGTYSLEPSSKAEEVTVSMLRQDAAKSAVVVNVLDATNLERNLYLTLQLLEQGYPVVVVLNMCDDMQHRGITIDAARLSEMLKAPVLMTCAVTGQGVGAIFPLIDKLEPHTPHTRTHHERWQEIGKIVEAVQTLSHRHHTVREVLEDASVRPFSGTVMAVGVLIVSLIVVRFIAEMLITYLFNPFFQKLCLPLFETVSRALGQSGFLHHILIGDLIGGKINFEQSFGLLTTAPYIELVMVLPYIIAFYLVLGILEDVGFLPRLAMLLDTFFHKLGLHGYAIIPVLLGFGCNVPGIIATRILESKRQRFIASTLVAIGVPCVAQQAMIVGILGKVSGFYVAGVYLILFFIWLVVGTVLHRNFKEYDPEFLLEVPPYRLPPLKLVANKLSFRIKAFLIEAFPVVIIGVFVVNVLLYLKVLHRLTDFFAPALQGLFGLPKDSLIALVMGFLRKDIAQGMLAPLGLSAKQLVIATVLLSISFPCIATFVVFIKELGLKAMVKAVVLMIAIGTVVGFLLNVGMGR